MATITIRLEDAFRAQAKSEQALQDLAQRSEKPGLEF